ANLHLASSRVHPYLSPEGRDMLLSVARSRDVTITSALRTIAEQYILKGGCAVAADPGRSNHETGRAIDVSNYGSVGGSLTRAGFGHPLPSSDPVHYDAPGDDLRRLSVLAFQRLWNANHPRDRIDDDGVAGPQTLARLGRSPAEGFATGRVCGACTPSREVCNGRDDDCDGRTDEGVTHACGRCGDVPRETCNGRDDDCDGRTDEGVTNACGACGDLPRETCNGRDDDCDGATDEDVCDRVTVHAELPEALDLGESYDVAATLENAGTTRWMPGTHTLVATADGASLSVLASIDAEVAPGESVPAGLTISPEREGEVRLAIGVARDGRALAGSLDATIPSRRPPFGVAFVDVSVPRAVAPHEPARGWAVVRNEGREAWPAATRLGAREADAPVAGDVLGAVEPGAMVRVTFTLDAERAGVLDATLVVRHPEGHEARWPDPTFPLRVEVTRGTPSMDAAPPPGADGSEGSLDGGCSAPGGPRRARGVLPFVAIALVAIALARRRGRPARDE
ncbi:MAG: hypothetical protein IT379_04765, partial [Deltaproteobacteria bacterium]|nr:hypothetical protein [Deltaproteobacteria bacterium]